MKQNIFNTNKAVKKMDKAFAKKKKAKYYHTMMNNCKDFVRAGLVPVNKKCYMIQDSIAYFSEKEKYEKCARLKRLDDVIYRYTLKYSFGIIDEVIRLDERVNKLEKKATL